MSSRNRPPGGRLKEVEALLRSVLGNVQRGRAHLRPEDFPADESPLVRFPGHFSVFFDWEGQPVDPQTWELAAALHVYVGKRGVRLELRAELEDIHGHVEEARIVANCSSLEHMCNALADFMEKLDENFHL
jgi:hypothetical protein